MANIYEMSKKVTSIWKEKKTEKKEILKIKRTGVTPSKPCIQARQGEIVMIV